MAIAEKGGWDFVKQGKTYQFKTPRHKQEPLVGRIKILEDNSTDKNYIFLVQVEKCTEEPKENEYTITHSKDLNDQWVAENIDSLIHIYPKTTVKVKYNWQRKK